MLDIDDIIRELLAHPARELYYSISENKFLDRRVSDEEYESNPDLCLFYGAKKCWESARKGFMARYPGVFPELPTPCPAKRWNALVEENGLEQEWFAEFRLALAENVTRFVQVFCLEEVEAPSELYRKIKEEMRAFEAKHYERKYSDMVLFTLGADYEYVPMTVLGNAGNVYGVSFYPSDERADNYLLVQNQERMGMDCPTANAISTMVSFYFEKETLLGMPFKDPYKSGFHFTSAYLTLGTVMHSCLPKSIAIRALNYLEVANREMANFVSLPQSKIKDNQFYSIGLNAGKISVNETDPHDQFVGDFPFDFRTIRFLDPALKFKKGGAMDFAVKCLSNYRVNPKKDDRRIENFAFIAVLCDHDSGDILIHSLGVAKNYRPFDHLVESLSKDLEKITLPKTFYVNNYFDYCFFGEFFAPYIKKNKLKVEICRGELASDEAVNALDNYLLDEMEGEDEEDLFPQKKIAEA